MKFRTILLLLVAFLFIAQVIIAQEKGVQNKPVTKLPSKAQTVSLIIGVDDQQ